MKYKAEYGSSNQDYKTNYYPTKEEAQDALMKKCGNFHYLGKVAGDSQRDDERPSRSDAWSRFGYCSSAPRNGGLVVIVEKEEA